MIKKLTFVGILLLSVSFGAYSQNIFIQSIDSNHILIGDQLILTQQSTTIPKDNEPLGQLKELPWFEVIDPGIWILNPNQKYERKIKFSVYDSGYYTIPTLSVKFDSQVIQTYPLSILVELPTDSTNELRPIKDILITKSTNNLLLYILLGCVFIAMLLFLLFFLYRADRFKPKTIQYLLPEQAHELALNRLQELENKKLWQNNQIKNYYDELNHILRKYLSEGFKIPALESTTIEIVDSLSEAKIQWKSDHELITFLRYCDLVRFANKSSEIEDHINWMHLAKTFVILNKDASIAFLEENKKDYLSLLEKRYALQFQEPREIVHETFIQLFHHNEFEELILVSSLSKIHKFNLPSQWVNLHRSKLGQVSTWHTDVISQYNGVKGVLLILILLPIISAFLPILYIIGLTKKENIFSRGIFVLSKEGKLLVDTNKL